MARCNGGSPDLAGGRFRKELEQGLDRLLDDLERLGFKVKRFAISYDGHAADGSAFHGSQATGYAGLEGAAALLAAADVVLKAAGQPALGMRDRLSASGS